jgi:hypothetical protein
VGKKIVEQKEESSKYKGYKYSLNNPGKWFKIFTLLQYKGSKSSFSYHIFSAFIIHELRRSMLVLRI